MRLPTRIFSFVLGLLLVLALGGSASAQLKPRPRLRGHKMRIKIDSQPQQAAIYVDSKDYGIEGYTPATLRLPKGTYTIILELPGFQPVQRPLTVTRSEAFVFTLERQARPAVLDVRSVGNDSATGGQLYVDGAALGTVPAKVEVAKGHHLIEVKKPGFRDFRDTADVQEGDTRTLVVDLVPEAKKGAILVVADVAGADVYVDGQRRDAAPALIGDLVEGPHTVEVRKDPLPPFRQVVNVVGGQQVKVEARLNDQNASGGALRVLSTTPGATVLVDGQEKGPAGGEITGLQPGQHAIEVRAPGYTPQQSLVNVVAGQQTIAKIDLQQGGPALTAHLRVVTPEPDVEVFIDGASVGKAPVDRNDLSPGKHYIVARKPGFAEWQREVNLDPLHETQLTIEMSASGTLKVLSNVAGADVYIDGAPVGKTPLTLDKLASGEHVIEVKKAGYVQAKQPFHIEGGEQKILSADLAQVRTGPTQSDYRSMSSFSAVTIEPSRFTADLYGGFYPFGGVRLTVGALRRGALGLDAGVEVRTIGYLTEGGAHAKFQFLKAGPVAMGADVFVGGGGGPGSRNDFVFEVGAPFTLLFGHVVRFTAHPYFQVYTDRNCPEKATMDEPAGCSGAKVLGQNPRDRYAGARLMLQAALEIVVAPVANIFFIFEAAPLGPRASYSQPLSPGLLATDPQVYGRMGVTFKF
ncbi:MAG: PEGA domain-containing protein [Polyangia bacterium]